MKNKTDKKNKRKRNHLCTGCKHYNLTQPFPETCVDCVKMMKKTELGDKYEE